MKIKGIFLKTISYFLVLGILFYLSKGLIDNWQKVKSYEFSFNYFYLILSFVFFIIAVTYQAFVWNSILRDLSPKKTLSHLQALKFFVYSWFGRYIPGKAWMYMARVYLGAKQGLEKKALTLSVVYELVLTVTSGFFLPVFLMSVIFGKRFLDILGASNLYLLFPFLIMFFSLVFIHPRIFYFFTNFVFTKILKNFKGLVIEKKDFLSYSSILKAFFYYCFAYMLFGTGFFFLIKSIIPISFSRLLGVIGIFELSSILGVVAFFAPSGLGVREGVMVLSLQLYFPVSIAILISLISRVWATLGEVIILSGVWLWTKIKGEKMDYRMPV